MVWSLGALRKLIGNLCVLAGAVLLLYGFVGCVALLFASLPGEPGLWAADESWIHTSWRGLVVGFLLLWTGYFCLTSHEDVEHALRQARWRHLSALADLNSPRGRDTARTTQHKGVSSWKGLLVEFATLWAMVWLTGSNSQSWFGDWQWLAHSGGAAIALVLAAGGFVLIHELGHLVGAWQAGVHGTGLQVGTGPRLLGGQWGRVKWNLHAWPWSGFVLLKYHTEDHFRWRNAIVYAGGPVAHALAIAAVVWATLHTSGGYAHLFVALVVLGTVLLFFGSLVPFRKGQIAAGGTTAVFLDSAALLNTPRLPAVHIRWMVGLGLCSEAAKSALSAQPDEQQVGGEMLAALWPIYPEHTLLRLQTGLAAMHRRQWAEAAHWLEKDRFREAAVDPVPVALFAMICTERLVALAMSGEFARTRAECLESLASDETDAEKSDRLDRLACLPFMRGLSGYWEEALDWIARARDLAPDRITLQGTYGSLLVELGRLEEARAVLEHVRSASRAENDQGICAFYLAIMARRQGRHDEAESFAAEAFRRCPAEGWMKTRWEQELSTSVAFSTP